VSANIGERVRVTVQITIPDYSSSIIIEDLFPGALEPLDDNIYDNSDSSNSGPIGGFAMGRFGVARVFDYWSWYMYRAFSVKEFKEDRVKFYGQQLFAGTHTVSYIALVNTEGVFALPPAHAYDSLQPELMGLSAGGTFTSNAMSNLPPPYSATAPCLVWTDRLLERARLRSPQPEIVNTLLSQVSTLGQYWWAFVLFIVGGILLVVAAVFVGLKAKNEKRFERLPKVKTTSPDDADTAALNQEASDSDELTTV